MDWNVLMYSVIMAGALSIGIVMMKKEKTYFSNFITSVVFFSVFFEIAYLYIQLVIK